MDQWVLIQNPTLEGTKPSRVTRDAFLQTWKAKGFEEVSEVEAKVAELVGSDSIKPLDSYSKDQLAAAASLAGADAKPNASKPTLITALNDALTPESQDDSATSAADSTEVTA